MAHHTLDSRDPHDDDRPIGRILDRRDALRLVGAGGMASLVALNLTGRRAWAAAATAIGTPPHGAFSPAIAPSCIARPELTEGPYFVDHQLVRSDIRTEPSTGVAKPGLRLALALTVADATGGKCAPLAGATVDVWHCDAQGAYSGVEDPMAGRGTIGQKFLRGVQTTDVNGLARFTTIYPGWYQGRTVHIHFKIRTTGVDGRAYEFTSQWFFDDALNDKVMGGAAYARAGRRDTRNPNDDIFQQSGGRLTLAPTQDGAGLAAAFAIGLDLADAAVGRSDHDAMGRGRGGPGGRGRGRGGARA